MDESAKDTFRQAPDAPEGDRISTDGMGAGNPGDAPVSAEDIARAVAEHGEAR